MLHWQCILKKGYRIFMEHFPLISVIVPIYNVEKYVTQCLDSIVNQTYTNLEILLIDDGSQDNSGIKCDEYATFDPRIKVIHKENKGVSSARNVGLNLATGEWIYFIDPDDWIELNTLELALKEAIKSNTDMCLFNFERYYKSKSFFKSSFETENPIFFTKENFDTLKVFMSNCYIFRFIVKAQYAKKIKFDEKLTIHEDILFCFKLYNYIQSFSCLNKILYHYRLVLNSAITTQPQRQDFPQMILYLYDKMSDLVANGKYPDNAQIYPNSKVLSSLSQIVNLAFGRRKFSIIQDYISTNQYKTSLLNYDIKLISKSARVYILLKNSPKMVYWIIYMLTIIKRKINFILLK